MLWAPESSHDLLIHKTKNYSKYGKLLELNQKHLQLTEGII